MSAAPRFRAVALAALLLPALALAAPSAAVRRCGWWSNPTPGNAWLIDREASWQVSVQGGPEAEGDWPEFRRDQLIDPRAPHSSSCACMAMEADPATHVATRISDAHARPLSACRGDRALKGKEPAP